MKQLASSSPPTFFKTMFYSLAFKPDLVLYLLSTNNNLFVYFVLNIFLSFCNTDYIFKITVHIKTVLLTISFCNMWSTMFFFQMINEIKSRLSKPNRINKLRGSPIIMSLCMCVFCMGGCTQCV